MNDQRFTFLCTKEDRRDLKRLAEYLHRSQGDTIRMLIRNAVQIELNTSSLNEIQLQNGKNNSTNLFGGNNEKPIDES